MKVDFVDSHQEEHGVQPILLALEGTPAAIAPSTYYAAKTRPASRRSRRDAELTALIKQIHAENYGVYGARKIWHEILRRGVRVARCTVERLMREAGLRDVTCWLRPEAHTCPQRVLCHTYGRGKDTHIMVPGWPYSLVTALETGRSSWTAPLDARRLAPGDDTATVTAAQLREVVERLITARQWQPATPTCGSSRTPATTAPGWRSCSRIYP
ncbi:hypothetical protein Acsp01_82500 [Actinoplanes sp. NBRC 101535]|nr:hypothetical protein Acsp01_82500 [Actinoplanes sp. NBRC 101535]